MTDTAPSVTVDPAEVARFSAIADEWWDPRGKFAPLHRFNPVRLAYIKEAVCRHFGRDARDTAAFGGLRLLDIGCGGGLLSEPLARLGASVVGVDPSETNVRVAAAHAARTGVHVDYRATTAEALAAAGESFDVVLAMEVVEHVADVPAFVAACAAMVRPGGLFLAATINRTPKAFLLAIVGAEYVLGWLPRGTHSYDKLVRPAELRSAVEAAGLAVVETPGVTYNPLLDRWDQSRDTDVNYMMLAARGR
jgi:2-polyprenyl-6-hydroxyphenyl methylase/3-demethylubiquinone-9 3-methyltransferase